MAIIVVARLRLGDPSLLDEFFTHAAAVLEQAQKTDGNLGADAFADAHNVWWDVTAWQSRAQIEVFMNTEPHLSTRGLADHLCDEASFVDWEQTVPSSRTGRPAGVAWWPTAGQPRSPTHPTPTRPGPFPLPSSHPPA
jgi:quinol monooxygenase YgiN